MSYYTIQSTVTEYERIVFAAIRKNEEMSTRLSTPLYNIILQRQLWETLTKAHVCQTPGVQDTITAFILS
jgi:hypothetical protein